jgi:hypothetical protein
VIQAREVLIQQVIPPGHLVSTGNPIILLAGRGSKLSDLWIGEGSAEKFQGWDVDSGPTL